MAVLGLLVEDRLKAESLAAEGLIPIDTSVLSRRCRRTSSKAGRARRRSAPWRPGTRPQGEFALAAQYKKPPAEMAVTTSLLLIVADKGQEVLGGLSLLPRVEKRFSFDVSMPAGWQVTSVNAAGGRPLSSSVMARKRPHPNPLREGQGDDGALPKGERTTGYSPEGRGDDGLRPDASASPCPTGIPVGERVQGQFSRRAGAAGLAGRVAIDDGGVSAFAVVGATHDEGAIAVDLPRRYDGPSRSELVQLTPLDAAEKPKYGLADVATTLAYRYEKPQIRGLTGGRADQAAADRADVLLPPRRSGRAQLPLRIDLPR